MASASTMPVSAADILKAATSSAKQRPSTLVDKDDCLTYDLGHLAAFDPSELDAAAASADRAGYLRDLTRDNMQLLTNKL